MAGRERGGEGGVKPTLKRGRPAKNMARHAVGGDSAAGEGASSVREGPSKRARTSGGEGPYTFVSVELDSVPVDDARQILPSCPSGNAADALEIERQEVCELKTRIESMKQEFETSKEYLTSIERRQDELRVRFEELLKDLEHADNILEHVQQEKRAVSNLCRDGFDVGECGHLDFNDVYWHYILGLDTSKEYTVEELRGAYRRMMRVRHLGKVGDILCGEEVDFLKQSRDDINAVMPQGSSCVFDVRHMEYYRHLDDLMRLQRENVEYDINVYTLESRICELENKQDLYKEEVEDLRGENDASKHRSVTRRGVDSERELKSAFCEKRHLNVEWNKINHDMKWIKRKIDFCEMENGILSDGIESMKADLVLARERTRITPKNKVKESSSASSSSTMEAASKMPNVPNVPNVPKMPSASVESRARVEALENELKQTKKKLKYLERDYQDANREILGLRAKKINVRDLQNELILAKSTNEDLQYKCLKQSDLIPDLNKVFDALEQVKSSCDAIKTQMASKDEVVENVKKSHAVIQNLREQCASLKNELEEKDSIIAELRESEKVLSRRCEEIRSNEKVEEDVKRLEREKLALGIKLKDAEKNLVKVEGELDALKKELEALNGVKEEVVSLKEELKKTTEERETLKKKLEDLNGVKEEVVSLKEELKKIIEERDTLNKELDASNNVKEKVVSLKEELKKIIEERDALIGKLKTLNAKRKEVVSLKAELEKITEERDTLKETIDVLNGTKEEVVSLKAELEKITEERDKLKGEVENHNGVAEKVLLLSAECENLRKKAAQVEPLSKKLQAVKKQYDDLVERSKSRAKLMAQFQKMIEMDTQAASSTVEEQDVAAEAMISLSRGGSSSLDFEKNFGKDSQGSATDAVDECVTDYGIEWSRHLDIMFQGGVLRTPWSTKLWRGRQWGKVWLCWVV